jgi:hypothetical protein
MMPRGGIREGSGRKKDEMRFFTVGSFCESRFQDACKAIKPLSHDPELAEVFQDLHEIPATRRRKYRDSFYWGEHVYELEEILRKKQSKRLYEKMLDDLNDTHKIESLLNAENNYIPSRYIKIKERKHLTESQKKIIDDVTKIACDQFNLKKSSISTYWQRYKNIIK